MGAVLCLVSAACFGAMAIFGKFAYAAGVEPGTLLLIRFVLAATLLGAVLALRPDLRRADRAGPQEARVGRPGRQDGRIGRAGPGGPRRAGGRGRVVLVALGLGAVGYATQAALYFSALQRMDASVLSLILYTYPLMVTVAAVLLGRDRLTPPRTLALVVASGGTVLVLLGAGGMRLDPLGTALAFGSAVTYTIYILVADTVVHRLPPVVLTALVMAGAAGALAAGAAVTGGVDLGFAAAGWFWLACIAVVSTVLAILTFFAGLRRTGPSAAAILSTFEPVVTTGLAALMLGETLTGTQLAGGVLVLCAVIALQVRAGAAPREMLEPEHSIAVDGSPHARSDRDSRVAG